MSTLQEENMRDIYITKNGAEIGTDQHDILKIRWPNVSDMFEFDQDWHVPGETDLKYDDMPGYTVTSETYKALEEYFLAKSGILNGAWVDPETRFLVYAAGKDKVNIVDTSTGSSCSYPVSKKPGSKNHTAQEVLNRYIQAHPEKVVPQREGAVIQSTGSHKTILHRSCTSKVKPWRSLTGIYYTDEEAWDYFNGEFVELVPKETS